LYRNHRGAFFPFWMYAFRQWPGLFYSYLRKLSRARWGLRQAFGKHERALADTMLESVGMLLLLFGFWHMRSDGSLSDTERNCCVACHTLYLSNCRMWLYLRYDPTSLLLLKEPQTLEATILNPNSIPL
jgi:hypothetical protein